MQKHRKPDREDLKKHLLWQRPSLRLSESTSGEVEVSREAVRKPGSEKRDSAERRPPVEPCGQGARGVFGWTVLRSKGILEGKGGWSIGEELAAANC